MSAFPGKKEPGPFFRAIIWAVAELQLLFLGDIVGRPGRELVRKGLASLIEHYNVDLVIANAENAAAGRGITRELGDALLGWGVDVMTSGNHIWAQRETVDYIGTEPRLLRTPLVRGGNRVSLGHAPDDWNAWLAAETQRA